MLRSLWRRSYEARSIRSSRAAIHCQLLIWKNYYSSINFLSSLRIHLLNRIKNKIKSCHFCVANINNSVSKSLPSSLTFVQFNARATPQATTKNVRDREFFLNSGYISLPHCYRAKAIHSTKFPIHRTDGVVVGTPVSCSEETKFESWPGGQLPDIYELCHAVSGARSLLWRCQQQTALVVRH